MIGFGTYQCSVEGMAKVRPRPGDDITVRRAEETYDEIRRIRVPEESVEFFELQAYRDEYVAVSQQALDKWAVLTVYLESKGIDV